MRQSRFFYKTLKTIPKEIETLSAKYLLKGSFIDQLAAGIYSFLPLGWRVHQKIGNLIREEMNKIGGQELQMPVLQPKQIWQETGRWETIDPPLFKLEDRHKKEFALGSTHEEVITDIIRERITSYKQLPQALYQIQVKFRNEMRPTGGLLRTREFFMKDLYSFHSTEKDLDKFFLKVKRAYFNIYKKCGLKALAVEASSGTIGGKESKEFMVLSEVGEDTILICQKCGFAANIEVGTRYKSCPKCQGKFSKEKAIEVGHIFKLGTEYSQKMKAFFTDKDGNKKPIIMGCYGIGLGRLLATIVEISHDEWGIIWPESISPFDFHLLAFFGRDRKINKKIKEVSEKIYQTLQEKKYEVLYDDREKISFGEKLAEADLLGIPKQIIVSEKSLKQDNKIEFRSRKEKREKLISFKELLKKF